MVEDDNKGNGNYLVQSLDGTNYLYISVTDPSLIVAGTGPFQLQHLMFI